MGKNKDIQFNLSRRTILENCLKDNKTATEIANLLGFHKSTISREIKNYRILIFKQEEKPSICSLCLNNKKCTLRGRCGSLLCKQRCVGCKSLKSCDKYHPIICHIETRFPFICNSCPYIGVCGLNHYKYNAKVADETAYKIRRESRLGIDLTPSEFNTLNDEYSKGVALGQSIYHINQYASIKRSVKTIYNYVNNGHLSIKRHNLPRAVTLKKRKKLPSRYEYNENHNIDRGHRMYIDWIIFQSKNKVITYWEMDFLGAPQKSKQQILTLVIPKLEFIYLIPIREPNQELVKQVFDMLEHMLGLDDFILLFPAIITDRDSKFNAFREMEVNDDGIVRTHVFFCDPSISNEKPSVENFNGQIRAIFPKGVILDNITLEQCNEISSHLNSRFLNSIDGARPLDLFIAVFGESIYHKLGLRIIKPEEVKILKFRKY